MEIEQKILLYFLMPYLLRIVLLIFRQIKNMFFKDFVTFVLGLWSIEFFNRYQWLPIQQKQRPENQNNDAKTMEFTELETRFSDNQTHHYLHHHHHYTTSSLNFYTVINVGDKNTKKITYDIHMNINLHLWMSLYSFLSWIYST